MDYPYDGNMISLSDLNFHFLNKELDRQIKNTYQKWYRTSVITSSLTHQESIKNFYFLKEMLGCVIRKVKHLALRQLPASFFFSDQLITVNQPNLVS